MPRRALTIAVAIAAVATVVMFVARGQRPRDPAEPPAEVALFDDGRPIAGRWVVFHDADGEVRGTALTSDGGRASGLVGPGGGMVTVAYGESIKSAVTILGVLPGDRLVIGEDEDDESVAETVCTARIRLPAAPPAAARYTVSLGVGATPLRNVSEPVSMSVLTRFIEDGTFQVLAEAADDAGEALAFAHARFGGCTDGGVVDARLPEWSHDFRSFTLRLDGADAGTTVSAELAIAGEESDRVERGRRYAQGGAPVTFGFRAPRPLGTNAVIRIAASRADGGGRSLLVLRRVATPEQLELDLGKELLPVPVALQLRSAGGPRPELSWKGGAGADGSVMRVTWPETGEHVWTIIGPPGLSAVRLPALPPELTDWRPDARPLSVSVALVEASFVDGYPALKAKGLGVLSELPEEGDSMLRYSVQGHLDF